MSAIAANCNVPVSVKCRIGVDNHDSYEELCEFSSETFGDDFLIYEGTS
jgi:tRNA-dihydrouridine synthase